MAGLLHFQLKFVVLVVVVSFHRTNFPFYIFFGRFCYLYFISGAKVLEQVLANGSLDVLFSYLRTYI